MNKRNFVHNYTPLKDDFDALQNDLEGGIKDVAKAVAGMGILSGLTVSISGADATVSSGVAFDGQGNRMAPSSPLTISIGSITRPSAGKYKWVTIALRYEVKEEGQVIDGNNVTWPARLLDSSSLLLLEGNEGEASNAIKPDYLDWQVPLLDIRVDHSSLWENLVTDSSRRPSLIPIALVSENLKAVRNEFENYLINYFKNHPYVQMPPYKLDGVIYRFKKPSEVWSFEGYRWSEIPYNGHFFRAKGGAALPFEDGTQKDAIRRIQGEIGGPYAQSSYIDGKLFLLGNNYSDGRGIAERKKVTSVFFDTGSYFPDNTAEENRPINETVIYWILKEL